MLVLSIYENKNNTSQYNCILVLSRYMDFDFFDVPAAAPAGGMPPPDAGGDKPKGRKKIVTKKPEGAAAKKKPKKALGAAKGKKKIVKKPKAGASAGASGNNDLDDFLGDLSLGGGSAPAGGGDDLGMDDFFGGGGGGGGDDGGDEDEDDDDEEEEEEEEQPTPKKGKKNKNGAVSIDDADFGFDLDDLAASTSSKKGGKKKKKGADIDDIDLGLDDLAISEGTPKKKDKKKKGGTNIEDLDLQGSISSALAVEKKKISNLDELDFTGAVKVKEGALDDFLGPGGDLTESTSGLESNNGTSYMETSGCNEPEMQKLGKDKILGFYISDDQGKLLFHREFLKQKKRGDEIDPEHGFYEQVKIATQPLWQDSITSYQATVVTNYPVVFGTLNGYIMYIVGSGMYDEIFCQFLLGEIVTLISQLGVKKFTPETWKDTNFMGKFYTALDEMILDGCVETLDQGFIDRQAKLKPFKF